MLEMPPVNQTQLFNQMGQLFLTSLEEVIGPHGVDTVLRYSDRGHLLDGQSPNMTEHRFQADDLGAIHQSLEEVYGHNGGRGLAQCTGRAFFKYGIRELAPVLGMTDVSFRLLPLRTKLKTGTQAISSIFSLAGGRVFKMDETENTYRWHLTHCPACSGRRTNEPVCHLAVGILQEAFSWLSCGRSHVAEEVACIAQGDQACIIQVHRQPLD